MGTGTTRRYTRTRGFFVLADTIRRYFSVQVQVAALEGTNTRRY